MGKPKTSEKDIAEIIRLRKSGLSLDSIHKIVPQGKTTIFNYIRNIKVDFDLRYTSSKRKSIEEWQETKKLATELLCNLSRQSRLLVLAALYWGEGNKRELNLINGDPELIRVFLRCLTELGVKSSDIGISLRLFEDIDRNKARRFWSKVTGLKTKNITSVEVIKGKEIGKLKHGMCRVRVVKGRYYFKLIMNMIDLIKSDVK